LRVGAKMPASGQAIPAMSTGDVSLAYYEIAPRKTFHVIAHSLNSAHKLVADRHWHRDRFLRPRIPVVDVHVSPADRGLQHADEHVVALNFWNRNFLEPEARLSFGLYDRFHHFLHEGKLGESGKQESRKVPRYSSDGVSSATGRTRRGEFAILPRASQKTSSFVIRLPRRSPAKTGASSVVFVDCQFRELKLTRRLSP
jgi:hypothetical protein